jgi:PBP1b-binding outer membrane lipoprotein LpoB
MKKINILYIIFISLILFQSCATIKEGFSSQKKKSTDEFLVEKKSPLVMPPDYDKLPDPKSNDVKNINDSNVKSLITNNSGNNDLSSENNGLPNTTFEGSIIEKIKNN